MVILLLSLILAITVNDIAANISVLCS